MKLLLTEHTKKLIEHGRATSAAQLEGLDEPDHMPVVKLFTPDANCTWLISELDPDDPDLAFGLCDLGFRFLVTLITLFAARCSAKMQVLWYELFYLIVSEPNKARDHLSFAL